MRARVKYIDSLKGIAILLVVMGHVIACFFYDWNVVLHECPNAMYWWRLIYRFHMPLMFFVSGYLYVSDRLLNTNLVQLWLHKVLPLILPFIFMGTINYLIRGSAESYWFLRTLSFYITLQMCYEMVRKHIKKSFAALIADIMFIVVTWLFIEFAIKGRLENCERLNVIFDFQHLIWCWLYFSIGVFMRRYGMLEKMTANKHISVIYPLVTMGYIYLSVGENKALPYYVNLICVFCVIISIFIISRERLTEGKIAKVLQYCGRHTLEIYVIHPFFLLSLPFVGDIIILQCNGGTSKSIMNGECIELIASLCISIGTIALCALIYEPMKSFPLLYKCFFGREIVSKK